MADRAALLIAVETLFEAGPPLPYAAADVAELARALPAIGYDSDKIVVLTGHRTTKAAIESHLARLPKLLGKPESLLVLVVSRAFSRRGRGFIACADTLGPDLAGTSIAIADFVAAIHKTRCPEITLLLDLDPLAIPGELAPSGLDETELKKLCVDSPACVALLAAAPGERSFESAHLRHGVWRHHLIEAFTGKVRLSVSKDGTLTAASLHAHLADAVPLTVRRAYESPQEQTPLLFGEANAGAVVADLASVLGAGGDVLDPARMRRVVFRAESIGRVKDLAGFRKTHTLPERANDWARKYVNRVARPDIQTDLDRTFEAVREAFRYKRKDLEVSAERDGVGFLRTPDFEYTVSVEVSADDPTEVVWRREVGRLADPDFVRSEAFETVFGSTFDRLVFEFAAPVNVEEFVDRIEEESPVGVKVTVARGSNAAEVKLAGVAGRLTVRRDAVEIEGRGGETAGLLDRFLAFLRKFQGVGESRGLRGG